MIKEAFVGFSKPSIAVDTVMLRVCDYGENTNRQIVKKQLQVLLVKKSVDDLWHLPGTIMRLGETSEAAISRIIKDKSKMNDIKMEQLYTVDNDLERDERGHVISIVYIGMISNQDINESLDIMGTDYDAQWFWISKDKDFINIRSYDRVHNLKYDHNIIIEDTLKRLKGKLMYTDVGFNFIGDMFTIRQLENTFEAINERAIPGFRRLIQDKIESTDIMSSGNAYRPAVLFKKKQTDNSKA